MIGKPVQHGVCTGGHQISSPAESAPNKCILAFCGKPIEWAPERKQAPKPSLKLTGSGSLEPPAPVRQTQKSFSRKTGTMSKQRTD